MSTLFLRSLSNFTPDHWSLEIPVHNAFSLNFFLHLHVNVNKNVNNKISRKNNVNIMFMYPVLTHRARRLPRRSQVGWTSRPRLAVPRHDLRYARGAPTVPTSHRRLIEPYKRSLTNDITIILSIIAN